MWVEICHGYEVSDTGQVRNKKTGRELKQFVGKDGYLRTQIAGKTFVIHRLVAYAFVRNSTGKDFVNHIDGVKTNNCASNLEWCTRSENMKHAYALGLKVSKGTKNGRSKLTLSDVVYIRLNYIPGDKEHGATALAKKFGVARQTICAVASGQNWGDLHV
jgi:hypothetical protein